MNKEFLDSIIRDFSVDKFRRFLRVNQSFVPKSERVVSYGDKNFSNGMLLGMIPFDGIDLQIFGFEVKNSLNERSGKRSQYEIARKVLKERQEDAGIFIFYDRSGAFRFSLIYTNYIGGKRDWSAYRRFTFFADKALANVTFLQRIGTCDFSSLDKVKDAFSVEKVTSEFFDKYKEIFFDLVDQFSKNKTFASEVVGKKNIKVSDFVKKLMGQIVFIYFLQKKGWLGVGDNDQWGQGNQNFVKNMYEKCLNDGNNFYNDFIEPLFYDTLGNRDRGNDSVKNDQSFSPYFQTRIPYLNGGLFEDFYNWKDTAINIDNDFFGKLIEFFDQYNFTVDENTPSDQEVSIDPEMLGKIFERLLEYKDRKSKGAYYTPREIVHYMCQESMINYLVSETNCPEERIRKLIKSKDSDLTVKFDEQRMKTVSQMTDLNEIAKKVYEALKTVKILDPAVGSGAFPMGMLNEITSTRFFLNRYFLHNKDEKGVELTEYHLKKETLENCIYGVDIDPGAVDIAKLRFWLALVVDHNIDDIEPLPNLDYKLMQGNSLIENYEGINLLDEKFFENSITTVDPLEKFRDEQAILGREFIKLTQSNQRSTTKYKILDSRLLELKKILTTKNKVHEFADNGSSLFDEPEYIKESKVKAKKLLAKQKEFFNTKDPQHKKDIKREIDDFAWELIESTLREEGREDKIDELRSLKESNEKPYFLFKLHFAEVFQEKGGFDIVIANPPYVGEKGHKDMFRDIRQGSLGKFHQGKMDLFYFFFHLALNLGNANSNIAFITTNYFPTATAGRNLREDFKKRATIHNLINFNELKIFESALGQHNMITILSKRQDDRAVALNCITKQTGVADSEILNAIVSREDDRTDYFEVMQSELFDGIEHYIRLPGTGNTDPNNVILLKILQNSIPLGTLCKVNLGCHITISKITDSHIKKFGGDYKKGQGVFVLSPEEVSQMGLNAVEVKLIKNFIKNSDIARYHASVSKEKLLYLRWEDDIELYPNIKKHLKKYDRILLDQVKRYNEPTWPWFSIHRPRDLELFETVEKIILPYRSKINTFGYFEGPLYASGDVFFMVLRKDTSEMVASINYLLGLLNSKLYYFWLYHRGKRKGEMLELYQQPLSEIPIKKISESDQKPFIEIVDKILAITKSGDYLENPAKKKEVEEYEKQIDQMVYKLYDLTPEEIEIIEEPAK